MSPRQEPTRAAVNWWMCQLLSGDTTLGFPEWAAYQRARVADAKHYTIPRLSEPDQTMVVRPMFPT